MGSEQQHHLRVKEWLKYMGYPGDTEVYEVDRGANGKQYLVEA